MAYSVNVKRASSPDPIEEVAHRLSEWLEQPVSRVSCAASKPDLVFLDSKGRLFLVECKQASDTASVAAGLRALRARPEGAIPILVVPFMGETGRALCQEAGVAWMDLSGNARLVVPGLRVIVDGRPNLYKRSGRPREVFAPKSARVARWLLLHPGRPFTQTEIAQATGLDPGLLSRVARRLVEDELVERTPDGRLVASRPGTLLDAWAEQYDFARHEVHKGVLAARSGTELSERIADVLLGASVPFAFTGLAAAWQYTHYAAYRLSTVYLPRGVNPALLADLGMHATERGANTWLVAPNDEGVVQGIADVGGLPCVHPVQVWLDLAAHPERASEAAERLRTEVLGGDLA